MNKNILVVEDDQAIREYLKDLLSDNGYVVTTTSSGLKALSILEKSPADLLLLDLGLPDIAGESVCIECKKRFPDLRIIILTAKVGVNNIVYGLESGADDYIMKPFTSEELLARIVARLRRTDNEENLITIGDLQINAQTFSASRNNKSIELTPQEFKLLHFLAINKNKVLTREVILSKLWFFSPDVDTRVVDVYIGYLRKKIDRGHKIKLINSVRGFGYMIRSQS